MHLMKVEEIVCYVYYDLENLVITLPPKTYAVCHYLG